MWFRQLFYRWLIPAAFVLPLWILVGWGVFQASGWAILWVLFIAMPSVFIGQLVFSMLIRARGTVRAERAVSWQDVGVMGAWHLVTIVVGTFPQSWFGLLLTVAIALGIAVLWNSLAQLWREAKGRAVFIDPTMQRTPFGSTSASFGAASASFGTAGATFDASQQRRTGRPSEVFIVTENTSENTAENVADGDTGDATGRGN